MRPKLRLAVVALWCGLAQLTASPAAVAGATPGPPFPLPSTFTGTTPCADCSGIDVTLTLLADGTYGERDLYRGRGTSFEDSGIWRYEFSSGSLILSGGHGSKTYYRVRGSQKLEQLDANGDAIVSSGSFALARSSKVVALNAPALGLGSNPWSLVTLDGEHVTMPAGAKWPTLKFDAAARRVSGSSGCNSLAGGYAQSGASLKFAPLATTRMACPAPIDAIEARFLKALSRTTAFRVEGAVLELRDGNVLLATFRAGN